jgi:hypothetical protein
MLAVSLLFAAGLSHGSSRIVSAEWLRPPKPDFCAYQELSLASNRSVGAPVSTPVARDPANGGVFCSIDISRLSKGNHRWHVWAFSRNGKASAKALFEFGVPPFAASAAQRKNFMRSHICPSTGRRSLTCPGYAVSHIVPLCAYGADLPRNMRYLPGYAAAEAKDKAEFAQCSPNLTPGVVALNDRTRLRVTEKAAHAGYEAALQAAEARIYAYGCAASRGTFDVSAYTDYKGDVLVELFTGGSYLTLTVTPAGKPKAPGSQYGIKGSGAFAGKKVRYTGQAAFTPLGTTMTLSGNIHQQTPKGTDRLSANTTKTFYYKTTSPAPYVLNQGEQSLVKNGSVQAKYRQREKSVRSDNFSGVMEMWKDRISKVPCGIRIHTEGSNDSYGFFQSGTLTIKRARN